MKLSNKSLAAVKLFLVLGFCLALPLFFIFSSTASESWVIDGDSVYINDSNAFLQAEPHTIYRSDWVYFNLTSKVYTGDIDAVWGFNTTEAKPLRAELYYPRDVNTTQSFTCNEDYFNYTWEGVGSPNNHFWCWRNITNYANNATNETIGWHYKLVAERHFEWGNLATKTAYWNVSKHYDWLDVSDRFSSVNYDFGGMNKWWYVTNVPIVQGKNYQLRTYIQVPIKLGRSQGKYWFAVKPSSESISEAIANGHLYYLDPWWDNTYDYRYEIMSNSTIASMPIVVNDTFFVNATPYWTVNASSASESVYVYCVNSACQSGAIAIANTTTEKPWVIENLAQTGNAQTDVFGHSSGAGGVWFTEQLDDLDVTANDNDGTSQGSGTITTGIFSNAYSTDADAERIAVLDAASISGSAGSSDELTVEIWFNAPTHTSGCQPIAKNKEAAGGKEWDVTIDNDGTDINFRVLDGTNIVCRSDVTGLTVRDGNWHYIVVQAKENDWTAVWVDGINLTTPDSSCELVDTTANLTIGAGAATYTHMNGGKVDSIKLWREIKTPAYIQQQYLNKNSINNFTALGSEEARVTNTAPKFYTNTTNFTSPATYTVGGGYNFSIEWEDTNAEEFTFELCNQTACGNFTDSTSPAIVNSTNNVSIIFSQSQMGGNETYQYRWYCNDTSGAGNMTTPVNFTVHKVSPTSALANVYLNLKADNSNSTPQTRTYPNATNLVVTSPSTDEGASDMTYTLMYNVSGVPPDTVISLGVYTFGARDYNLTYNASGGTNYTIGQVEILMSISKGTSSITSYINGTNTDYSIEFGAPISGGIDNAVNLTTVCSVSITTIININDTNYGDDYQTETDGDIELNILSSSFGDAGVGNKSFNFTGICGDANYTNSSSTLHLWIFDSIPPQIYNVSVNVSNTSAFTSGKVINVSFTAYDNYNGDGAFQWNETYESGSWTNDTANKIGVNNPVSHIIKTEGKTEGLYCVRVYVDDSTGNANKTDIYCFTLDDSAPAISNEVDEADQNYDTSATLDFSADITDATNVSWVKFEINSANYSSPTNVSGNWQQNIPMLAVGTYNWYWYASDNLTHEVKSTGGAITISQGDPLPKMSMTLDGNTSTLQERTFPNMTTIFANDTNEGDADCTIAIYLNGSDVTSTHNNTAFSLNGSTVWNYTFSYLSCSNWTDSQKEIVVTMNQNTSTSSYMTLLLDGSAANETVIYPNVSNVTAYNDSTVFNSQSIEFVLKREEVGGNTVLIGTNGILTDRRTLGNGTWNYTYNTSGNMNYSSAQLDFSVLVEQNSSTSSYMTLLLDDTASNATVIYPHNCNATAYNDTTVFDSQSSVTFTLYRNSELIGTDGIITTTLILGNATWNFTYNTSGNANYSSGQVDYSFHVEKGNPTNNITLLIDGNDTSPQFRTYPNETNTTGYDNATVDTGCTWVLYRNATDVSSTENNTLFSLNASGWNYTYATGGGTNWTDGQAEIILTMSQNATNPVDVYFNDSVNLNNSIITYETQTNVTAIAVFGQSEIRLWRNETDVTSENGTNITLGKYQYFYKANVTGSENYTANDTGATFNITVSQKTPTVHVELNGTEADKFYDFNTTANITIWIDTIYTVKVNLTVNFTDGYNTTGDTPLQNLTNLTYAVGRYNVTGFFEGDVNYSSTQTEHTLLLDRVYPWYDNLGQNTTNYVFELNDTAKLYANWTDDLNLSHAWLSTNESGVWRNYTDRYGSPVNFSVPNGWSNFTWDNNSVAVGTNVSWRIYANDTAGKVNVTSDQFFLYLNLSTIIIDMSPTEATVDTFYNYSWYWFYKGSQRLIVPETSQTWCENDINGSWVNGTYEGRGEWKVNYTSTTEGTNYYSIRCWDTKNEYQNRTNSTTVEVTSRASIPAPSTSTSSPSATTTTVPNITENATTNETEGMVTITVSGMEISWPFLDSWGDGTGRNITIVYPTRMTQVASLMLQGKLWQGFWAVMQSLNDFYWRPVVSIGIGDVLFKHFTIVVVAYAGVWLLVRWGNLLKKSSRTWKLIVYLLLIPVFATSVSLICPSF